MYYLSFMFLVLGSIFCGQIQEEIPCVDLKDYYVEAKREAFLKTIHEALKEYGFFGIVNSNIDEKLTERTYGIIKDFFAKPFNEKMQWSGENSSCQRGYIPLGSETAKGKDSADIKEFFHVGPQMSDAQAKSYKYWPNIWPNDSNFRSVVSDFKAHLMDFSVLIEKILAQSLVLNDTFFSEKTKNGETVLRMIHYPKYDLKTDKDACWASEHTDINLFTILPFATSKGLEVKTRSGKWVRVSMPKSAMIINAGDFLEIFTNGLYQSSVHRVKKDSDNKGFDRYSMVMFVHTRADEILEPIASCVALTGGKKKFVRASRYEMLMERLTDLGQATDEMLCDLRDSKVLERLILVGRASHDAMLALRKKGYASKEILQELSRLGL